jgi:hypothetical protein
MASSEVVWTVEIFRVVATGTIALLGAWGGFHLGNRGRKYDILYKEQYTSLKIVVSPLLTYLDYLTTARLTVNLLRGDYNSVLKYYLDGKIIEDLEIGIKQIHISLKENTKELIILREHTRKSYREILVHTASIEHEITRFGDKITQPKATQTNMLQFLVAIETELSQCAELIEHLIDSSYKDLKLPEFVPLFTVDEIEARRRILTSQVRNRQNSRIW